MKTIQQISAALRGICGKYDARLIEIADSIDQLASKPPSEAANKAAEELLRQYKIGTVSRFCDDTPDFDSTTTDEIAQILQKHFPQPAESVNGRLLNALYKINATSHDIASRTVAHEAISAQSAPPSMESELAEALRAFMEADASGSFAHMSHAKAEIRNALAKYDAQKGQR